jgi:large subunit ribosomal protein L21
MEYAVIATGGKQYKVSVGDIIEIDRLSNKKGEDVDFNDVLLVVSGEDVKVGKPKVDGVKVSAKILEVKRGEKIRVAKFRAKSKYRRAKGFRAELSQIKIEKISGAGKKEVSKKPADKKETKKVGSKK